MTPSDFDKLAAYKLRFGIHYGKPLSEVPMSYLRWVVSNQFCGLSRMDREVIEEYITELARREPTT